MEPIHKSEIVLHILDRSASNFDTRWGRPKGQIPPTTVTMWGQVKFSKEHERTNREQGDLPEADGHVWFRKPLKYDLERGDIIYSVESNVVNAEIIEVEDGVLYHKPRAVKVKFKLVRDG